MADSRPYDGPSLVLLAAMCIALLFGGLAIGVALGGLMPLPYGPIGPVQHYVQTQSLAVRIIAVAVFGSSVLLAVYAATVSARLRWLGDTGAAPTIALAGGILAAGMPTIVRASACAPNCSAMMTPTRFTRYGRKSLRLSLASFTGMPIRGTGCAI